MSTALRNTIAARATADYLATRHSDGSVDQAAPVAAAALIAFFAVNVGKPSTQKAVAADNSAALDLCPAHQTPDRRGTPRGWDAGGRR
ncbi:hypothetical protein ACWDE0_43635, partial [Streptomyces sp. 900105755]